MLGSLVSSLRSLVSCWMAMLNVQGVHAYYGNIHVLKGVSFSVGKGEIVALVGANGAGKTTTLRAISGLLRLQQGLIELSGERIDHLPPHEIVRRGIAHVPEGRRIFSRLTVLENLELGAFARRDGKAIGGDLDGVFRLFPRLKERRNQVAGTLSGGEQQMLAIGRALMARPKLLLLDEPSMGLAPILVETIFEVIEDINRQGTTILLVEQNAMMALEVAHRGYVMQMGRIVLQGSAAELKQDETVKKLYLGEE